MDRIEGNRFQTPLTPSDGATQAAEARGSYRGQEVVAQEDPMSLLADAAEEMTFAASEHVEKKVSERKPKTEAAPIKMEHAEEGALRTGKLKDLDPEKVKQFVQQLKEGKAESGGVKDLAQKTFQDPTERHAALSAALEQLKEDGGYGELRAAVETVLAEAEATEGPQIRAGYNINGVDSSAAGSAQEARDLYRQTVLGSADIAQTFTSLMEKYGPEGFTESLRFLMQALGADVAATTPSTDKEFLRAANNGLYEVELLGNLYRDAEKMLDQLAKNFDRPGELEPFALMKEILRLKDVRLVDPGAIRAFLRLQASGLATYNVLLVRGAKDLVYRMPLKIYKELGSRQSLLSGFQVVLDEVIAVEEEELAEQAEEEEAP